MENTQGYLFCEFDFATNDWDGTIKTACFRNPYTGNVYTKILDDNNSCEVPPEAIQNIGSVEVSLIGEKEKYRITTSIATFLNRATIPSGEPSEPPTPSQYDQMIALAAETKAIAESIRKDADEGKFNGASGENATDDQVQNAVNAYMAEHPMKLWLNGTTLELKEGGN